MTAPGTHGVFSCSGHLHRTAGNPGGEMRTPSSAGRVSLICEGGNAGVFRRKLWELACWERESLSADRKARVSGGRGLASRPYGLHISGCPCPRICQQFPWQLFSAQTWRPRAAVKAFICHPCLLAAPGSPPCHQGCKTTSFWLLPALHSRMFRKEGIQLCPGDHFLF